MKKLLLTIFQIASNFYLRFNSISPCARFTFLPKWFDDTDLFLSDNGLPFLSMLSNIRHFIPLRVSPMWVQTQIAIDVGKLIVGSLGKRELNLANDTRFPSGRLQPLGHLSCLINPSPLSYFCVHFTTYEIQWEIKRRPKWIKNCRKRIKDHKVILDDSYLIQSGC